MKTMRERVSRTHPIIGYNNRFLEDHEILDELDSTICLSMALTLAGDIWIVVDESLVGKTVKEALEGDMDADERIFRRDKRL
jgi:hypothetical protein